jgi:hypothetical protein
MKGEWTCEKVRLSEHLILTCLFEAIMCHASYGASKAWLDEDKLDETKVKSIIQFRSAPRPNTRCSSLKPFWTRAGNTCRYKTALARPKGFEPLTSAFGGQRSIQLSYGRKREIDLA